MKAVVLEVRGGEAAVLREDGTVERIRRSCRVGETIELEGSGRVTRMPGRAVKWTAAAAAAVVILASGGVYGFNNAYAYSYVTLDANPSLEYTLNRRNRVMSVTALNEDGEAIAENLSVKSQTLTEALDQTTELLYEGEYLDEGDCLLLNVTSRGETQQQELTRELDDYFSARDEELEVYVTGATREERELAGELGVSAGRYMVLQEIGEREEPGSGLSRDDAERLGQATVDELFRRDGLRGEEAPADDPAEEPPALQASGEMTAAAPAPGEETPARTGTEPAEAPGEDGTGLSGPPETGGEAPEAPFPELAEGNRPAQPGASGEMPG